MTPMWIHMITIDPVSLSDHHPQSFLVHGDTQLTDGIRGSESILFVQWLSVRVAEISSTPDSLLKYALQEAERIDCKH